MSKHKNIDRICVIAIVVSVLISLVFMNGEALGIQAADNSIGYESRLFDTSRVHTIDIVMDDWDTFLTTCQSEEYADCAVVIDGESYKNVAIRGKGNTSLSTVSSMDSERYSFKVEFDHYDDNKSYYGLDKLCLNNIIQDNTYMKDYLTYRLMDDFGVNAPLCSYVYITVNGEDWGLYLAVEGVEESFLERNYGSDYGELYKPDSMSFGGGRGNGKEFNMDDFTKQPEESTDATDTESGTAKQTDENTQQGEAEQPNLSDMQDGMPQMPDGMEIPDGFDFSENKNGNSEMSNKNGFGGMGSNDVKLQYIDDDADSYSNIFDNAKTDTSDADKTRLISSLKSLTENSDIESAVNIDEVIRYFVVHNFVCNGDSYTGSMIHNYYLYEENGQMSMIPWDYNLAYGTFRAGNADEQVNSPIDTPVSDDMSDRPMINWIFESEEYTELYHKYFSEFLANTDFSAMVDETAQLIAPYVKKDPTKFCTYEEFEVGVDALAGFCELREESVLGQLDGTIPSTSDEQNADSENLIDASKLNLSDMGTMNSGGGNSKPNFNGRNQSKSEQDDTNQNQDSDNSSGNALQNPTALGSSHQTDEVLQGDMQPPDNFRGLDGEMPKKPGSEMPSSSDAAESTDDNGIAEQGQNSVEAADENASDFSNIQMPQGVMSGKGSAMSYLILMGVSVAFLIAGLLFAFLYKK